MQPHARSFQRPYFDHSHSYSTTDFLEYPTVESSFNPCIKKGTSILEMKQNFRSIVTGRNPCKPTENYTRHDMNSTNLVSIFMTSIKSGSHLFTLVLQPLTLICPLFDSTDYSASNSLKMKNGNPSSCDQNKIQNIKASTKELQQTRIPNKATINSGVNYPKKSLHRQQSFNHY